MLNLSTRKTNLKYSILIYLVTIVATCRALTSNNRYGLSLNTSTRRSRCLLPSSKKDSESSFKSFSARATLPLNVESEGSEIYPQSNRRNFVKSPIKLILLSSILTVTPKRANAFPFGQSERRQVEFCLVNVLRVRYWAESTAKSIITMLENEPPTGMTNSMKAPYLEARLGAKAAITGKIGGGANERVRTLATFELRDCLKDARASFADLYGKGGNTDMTKAEFKKQRNFLETTSETIIESLADVVEFDGLETTTDPSPRSSLALSMYNDNKAIFIKRLLLERTVPNCDAFVNAFGTLKRDYCENYIRLTYPSEIPKKIIPSIPSENPQT